MELMLNVHMVNNHDSIFFLLRKKSNKIFFNWDYEFYISTKENHKKSTFPAHFQ
jgi:hypothetical protein